MQEKKVKTNFLSVIFHFIKKNSDFIITDKELFPFIWQLWLGFITYMRVSVDRWCGKNEHSQTEFRLILMKLSFVQV